MEKNNFKKLDAGCDKYGTQRLELAKYLKKNILPDLNKDWFLENGTLLGAWRNGKFIKHDDDFDIAMMIHSIEEAKDLYKIISEKLINSKYKARLVTTYSLKIEVFDESYGKYKLISKKYNGSDFHYVTLDIQFYLKDNQLYKKLYYIAPRKEVFNKDIVLPTRIIKLENEIFNAPSQIEPFLKQTYGSLDERAVYNPETGLYEMN